MAVKSKYALSFGFVISYPEDHPNHGHGIRDFLQKKYPNEKDTIDEYFNEQRLDYADPREGFYAQGGTTKSGKTVYPIGSTDADVEEWVSEDYEDFRDNRRLNEMDKKETKETKYGEIILGTPEWKVGPIENFLKKKFPNEKQTVEDFLYTKAPVTQRERMDYPGFYKGWDGSLSEIQPLKMTDQEAEAYFVKDYNRFKEEEGLNEWVKRQWQLRAGIIK